ncbi:MAG: hypothetical protein QMC27_04485, partial [Flavobacteriaceae bacterium]
NANNYLAKKALYQEALLTDKTLGVMNKEDFAIKLVTIESDYIKNLDMVLGLDIDFIDNEKKEITKLMSNIESYQSNQHSLITVVGKGKNSPKFISYLNSAGGTTSLDDLKGKYVYID